MYTKDDRKTAGTVAGYIGSTPRTSKEIEALYRRMIPQKCILENIRFENISSSEQAIKELMKRKVDSAYVILEEEGHKERFQMYFFQKCGVWDNKNSRAEPNEIKQENGPKYLPDHLLQLNLRGQKVFLNQNQIIYMERRQRTTYLYTEEGKLATSEKLDDLLNRMQKNLFVRCHVSFAVNLQYVKSFARTEVGLKNGESVPVSRKYYKSVRDAVCNRIEGNGSREEGVLYENTDCHIGN